jgi:hypothetical protein
MIFWHYKGLIMANRQLQSAYQLMEQGQKKEAAALVREVLQKDKDDPNAWWLMSMLLEDEDKKVRALERVLSIKPDHQAARAKLVQLRPVRETGQNVMATQEMMSLDWSKLKDDPHPDKQKEKAAPTDDHKIATYGMAALGIFLVVIIAIVAVYALINSGILTGGKPEDVAVAFMEAAFTLDYDALPELICEQYRAEATNLTDSLGGLAAIAGDTEITLDTSNFQAQVVEQTANTAIVQLNGVLVMNADSVSIPFDFNSFPEEDRRSPLVLEGGKWRICEPLDIQL